MRDLIKDALLITDEIEKRKSKALGRIRAHDLSVMSSVLYCSATTAALISFSIYF